MLVFYQAHVFIFKGSSRNNISQQERATFEFLPKHMI